MLPHSHHTNGAESSESGNNNSSSSCSSRTPVRLVVCADGTWCKPDGTNNITNVYRIFCSTEEGEVTDALGNHWFQKKEYFEGLDDPKLLKHIVKGAFGTGMNKEIEKIFTYCCQHAPNPEDEIYFFGFSRGAFAVRAVASLLTYMGIPDTPPGSGDLGSGDWDPEGLGSPEFRKHYEECLELYKDVRTENRATQAKQHSYFSKRARSPPRIKFIGVLDTVKAWDDGGLFEYHKLAAPAHCRQALAIHEKKTSFPHELWKIHQTLQNDNSTGSYSVKQGWFVGSHSDIGGGTAHDGLSLYPLQWIISEAIEQGLKCTFTTIGHSPYGKSILENPLELIFPGFEKNKPLPPPSGLVRLANGLTIKMWSLEQIHKKTQYSIELHTKEPLLTWILPTAHRAIFKGDELLGCGDNRDYSAFIHPSVYLLSDKYPMMNGLRVPNSIHGLWNYRRANIRSGEAFWNPTVSQILVCGHAGVGKTSLISAALQVKSKHLEEHHIEPGVPSLTWDCIMHEFRGFLGADPDEAKLLQRFLEERAASSERTRRLDAVWYCVSSTSLPTYETVDRTLFETLAAYHPNIPIIFVSTHFDQIVQRFLAEYYASISDPTKPMPDGFLPAFEGIKWETEASKEMLESIEQIAPNQTVFGPLFTDRPGRLTTLSETKVSDLLDPTIRAFFPRRQHIWHSLRLLCPNGTNTGYNYRVVSGNP